MWKIIPCLTFALAVALPAAGDKRVEMSEPKEPWFQLTPDRTGDPDYVRSPVHTRTQRQFLHHLWWYRSAAAVDELEQELNGGVFGPKVPGGYGVTRGGSHGFSFKGDGKVKVWFSYDFEAEGDDRYPKEGLELDMPMEEAEPLFRAWIASVRHWVALTDKHGTPLPPDKRPACYPPPAAN